MGFFLYIA